MYSKKWRQRKKFTRDASFRQINASYQSANNISKSEGVQRIGHSRLLVPIQKRRLVPCFFGTIRPKVQPSYWPLGTFGPSGLLVPQDDWSLRMIGPSGRLVPGRKRTTNMIFLEAKARFGPSNKSTMNPWHNCRNVLWIILILERYRILPRAQKIWLYTVLK